MVAPCSDRPVAKGKGGRGERHFNAKTVTLLPSPLADLKVVALAGPVDKVTFQPQFSGFSSSAQKEASARAVLLVEQATT